MIETVTALLLFLNGNMMHNEVNINRLQKDMEKVLSDIEKLKDKQRSFANGNGQ